MPDKIITLDNLGKFKQALDAQLNQKLTKKADLVDGKVPYEQLPASFDDVREYASLSDMPQEGESGVLYIAKDTNKQYRYENGYIELSSQNSIEVVIWNTTTQVTDEQINKAINGKLIVWYAPDRIPLAYRGTVSPNNLRFEGVVSGVYGDGDYFVLDICTRRYQVNLDTSTKLFGSVGSQMERSLVDHADNALGNIANLTSNGKQIIRALNLYRTQSMLASAYDATATYSVGDYAIYQNQLYICNTTISTTEAWNANHWTLVNIGAELASKVDAVSGKGLSSNDFTDAEKTKLAGIESGAQVNTVTSVAGKTGAVTLSKSDVGLENVDNTSDLNKPISTATQTALNLKADKATTYTKTATDTLLGGKADIVALDLKADKATTYTKTETDALLAPKANSADVYTKTTIDSLLSAKANSSDVYTKTAADGLLSAKANSSDVYTKAQVDSAIAGAGGLPTITIALSQVISQDPLQIQLTDEQYALINRHPFIVDASALGMDATIMSYLGWYKKEDITYLVFGFSESSGLGTYIIFKKGLVNTSTKVAEFSDEHLDVGYADSAESAARADSVFYSTTAPTSANDTGNIKIVVLSSEPAKRYDGYLYIITESVSNGN